MKKKKRNQRIIAVVSLVLVAAMVLSTVVFALV